MFKNMSANNRKHFCSCFFVSGILAFMSTFFYSLINPFLNYLNNIGITDSLRLVIGAISFIIMLISFILYFKIKIS